MKLNLPSLLYHFNGNWISKKNIYLLNNKIEHTYREYINIQVKEKTSYSYKYNLSYNLQNNNDIYFYNELTLYLNNIIEKNFELIKFYNIDFITTKLIKLKKKLKKKNLIYNEYICFINQNLTVSIGFIKLYDKYLAIVFTSYIKTSNKKLN
uniref:Uncharacterized protein n=1 Tax=Thuretia quercifolia TaxID=189650 RepID=A0A1Z1MKM8_9FLOR|nr:hypothetical protein [Thuretia quercifolia]ARW66402.1 hypothetical protein [Thuretia quercifolia]